MGAIASGLPEGVVAARDGILAFAREEVLLWHALRIVNIAGGTNEILNRDIVGRLLKGDTDV